MKNKIPLIHCVYKELWPIEKLKPHPANPAEHPEEQIKSLAKIINYQGWRQIITISELSGFIVRGHARLKAAQLLGLKEVPIDIQKYASEEDELADLVADNRIAELAEKNNSKLKDIIEILDTGAFDLGLTAYDQQAIEQLMTQYHVETEKDKKGIEFKKVYEIIVKCKDEKDQQKIYENLREKGYECRILTS